MDPDGLFLYPLPQPLLVRTPAGQRLVHARLVLQLRMLGTHALELDGYLLAADDVDSQVDVAKAATPDFASKPVLVPDADVGQRRRRRNHSYRSTGAGQPFLRHWTLKCADGVCGGAEGRRGAEGGRGYQ